MEPETVTITVDELNKLKRQSDWLNCLEAAGVDNWEGIDYAYEMWRDEGYAEKYGED